MSNNSSAIKGILIEEEEEVNGDNNDFNNYTITTTLMGEEKKKKKRTNNKKQKEQQYYVFLMLNLAEKATKHTEIRIAINPEATVFVKNQTNISQNQWVVVVRVGVFKNQSKAKEFFSYWEYKTRGVTSRIAKGIVLTNKYGEIEGITAVITPYTKEEQLKKIHKQHETKSKIIHNLNPQQQPQQPRLSSSLFSHDNTTNKISINNDVITVISSLKNLDPNKKLSNGMTIFQAYNKYSYCLKDGKKLKLTNKHPSKSSSIVVDSENNNNNNSVNYFSKKISR